MNIPNIISLCRLFAVPVIVWLILVGRMETAFWVVLTAAFSDAADGTIAKKFSMETVLGSFLDPIADKAMLVCMFVTLGYIGQIPTWLVILVVFRDALILGGALLFQTLTQSLKMTPLMVSKINTFAQLVLCLVVMAAGGFGSDSGVIREVLLYTVGITTLVSGIAYAAIWTRRAAELEDERNRRNFCDD